MKHWLTFPSIQIALCVAAHALVGYYFGVFAFLFATPLFAAIIARAIFALVANYRRRVLEHVWLPVHGHYYVFKGTPIHVLEDDERRRWVSLVDVRKVVGVTANEHALALAYPGQVKAFGKPAQTHIRDEALISHLSKETDATALRFRTWVERNIAFPGRAGRKQSSDQASRDDESTGGL